MVQEKHPMRATTNFYNSKQGIKDSDPLNNTGFNNLIGNEMSNMSGYDSFKNYSALPTKLNEVNIYTCYLKNITNSVF